MTWPNLRLAKNNTLGIHTQSATFSYLHRHISILATRMGTTLSFWWQSSWTLSKKYNLQTLGTLVLWTHRQHLIHQLLTPSITIKLISPWYCGAILWRLHSIMEILAWLLKFSREKHCCVDEFQQACLIHLIYPLVSEFPLHEIHIRISCFTLRSEEVRDIFHHHSADQNKHLL